MEGNPSRRWRSIQSPMPPVKRTGPACICIHDNCSKMIKIIVMNDNLHLFDSTRLLGKLLEVVVRRFEEFTHTLLHFTAICR